MMHAMLALTLALQDPPAPPPKAQEQPDVEVTSTRLEEPLKETGSAATIVDAERIAEEHAATPVDLLRGLPGFHLARTGAGRGAVASLFTRGTNSNHTLLLVDGFQFTRDGGRFFEYDALTPDNLERIEAVRGAASAVYGSDAIGGVVNLISRRGRGPATSRLTLEGGNWSTWRGVLELFGGDERFGYSLSLSRFEQAAFPTPNAGVEDLAFAGRFDVALGERTRVKLVARYVSADVEVPTNGPPRFTLPEPNAQRQDDHLLIGAEVVHRVVDGVDAKLRVSRLETEQLNDDPDDPNETFPGDFNELTNFDRILAELQVDARLGGLGTLTVGGEFESETITIFNNFAPGLSAEVDRNNGAVYAQVSLEFGGCFFVTPGVRGEFNQKYGNEVNGRIAGAYLHRDTSTKIRASAGTGITEPRLDQTVGFFGNPALRAERAVMWDVGVDQWLEDDRLRLSATYFEARLRDMILFDSALPPFGSYFNGGSGRTRGVEVEIEARIAGVLTVGASYTYLRTIATEVGAPADSAPTLILGEPFIRRPEHSGRVFAGVHVPELLGAFADVVAVGSRVDASFTGGRPPRETAAAFWRVDLSAWVRIVGGLRVVGRIENLLDTAYEEILGFPGQGTNFMAGLEYSVGL